MQRKALIVAGAAGPQDAATGVLHRYGFAPPATAPGIADALDALRDESFDLVVLPLQGISAVDLAAVERELRRARSMFVIGTAAQSDSDLILRAMRAGVHEFLVYPPDPKDFSAAVDRLMRRNQAERKAGALTAVYSAKGGLGTTTVAVNLAFALAHGNAESRVALADMVAGGGEVRVMLDLRAAYDMGDLAKKLDRLDGDLLVSMLTPCPGGVWALPASDDPESADALDGTATLTLVGGLRASFGHTVVDCEHHLSDRTLAVLDVAERILVVTQLNISALRSTQRTLALLSRLGYADEKVLLVVNRYQPGDVISLADAAQLLKREPYFQLPNDFKSASSAQMKGVPVTSQNAASPLAAAYTGLAAKLSGRGDQLANGTSRNSRLSWLLTRGRK